MKPQDLKTLIKLLIEANPEELNYALKRKYTHDIKLNKTLYAFKED